jgi:hypothetical protein
MTVIKYYNFAYIFLFTPIFMPHSKKNNSNDKGGSNKKLSEEDIEDMTQHKRRHNISVFKMEQDINFTFPIRI